MHEIRNELRMFYESLSCINDDSWKQYAQDPYTAWQSHSLTMFDTDQAHLGCGKLDTDMVVCSVAFDATATTRIGARYGPAAIRNASLSYKDMAKTTERLQLFDARTGKEYFKESLIIRDYGDLHVYPTNPSKQIKATIAEVFHITHNSNKIIILGGEHTITAATYYGVALAMPDKTIGYVQIDHHFDFGDESQLHGHFFHGSNARRISEFFKNRPLPLGLVGMGDLTSKHRYNEILHKQINVRTMHDIRTQGFEHCLRSVLDTLSSQCDLLYVSLDIDVCDHTVASGTGNVTIGGIDLYDFFSISDILKQYPVYALDIVEVSPQLDKSDTTASIVAKFLFNYIYLYEKRMVQ